MGYKVKKFIMSSGERGCLILDKKVIYQLTIKIYFLLQT
ncbi:putative site specific recombinase domain protein [Escherichia coli DEC3F]|nr:putative site specific recombinase domain protein [Escherichia coli DEC3E]EHU84216.1 putative site specific recombinase domain protein [Escherichia coli DEC3F]EHV04069.1 putative site specific recombinase domain protein [Escherichia coli DEC4D]